MLRGYRGIVAALGLVLAAHHPQAAAQSKQSNPQERSARALEDLAARYDEQAKRAERSRETEQCKQGDDKRYSDLCAQWKAADAAADSAWWAAVAGFATAISTVLVLIALRLAFGSNSIARDTAKRQLRAYCNICEVGPDGFGLDNEPAFVVTVINSGQTPARSLKLDTECVIVPNPPMDTEYRPDVTAHAEVTVGAGKFAKSRALLGHSLTQVEWDSLIKGQTVVMLRAHGEYLDIFNERQTFSAIAYVAGLPNHVVVKPVPGTDIAT
jgi:hypothetical protein